MKQCQSMWYVILLELLFLLEAKSLRGNCKGVIANVKQVTYENVSQS